MGRPLKIAKAQSVQNITATNAGSKTATIANTAQIAVGMPFVTASTIGGLTGGTTYWVLSIANATNFSASTTDLSANPNSTPVTLTTASGTVSTTFNPIDTGFNNPNGSSNTYGVVGGNTAIYGNQVLARVAIGVTGNGTLTANTSSNVVTGVGTAFSTQLSAGSALQTAAGVNLGFVNAITNATSLTLTANSAANVGANSYVYADNEPGFIVRQKGKTRYLVKGTTSGLTGQCYTANVANASLTPNTMNIVATYANSATAFVQNLSDIRSQVFYNTANATAAPDIYATFNSAAAANASAGITYPVATISKL